MKHLLILIWPALLGYLMSAQAGTGGTKDASAVKQAVAGFPEAWNKHDMVAFGRLFTRNADFVNVGGSWWIGRAAIQHFHAYSHGTIPETDTLGYRADPVHWGIFRKSTIEFDDIHVRFVCDDVAIARTPWHLEGDTRTKTVRTGMLVFVVVRTGGKWRITAAQNTEIHRTVH